MLRLLVAVTLAGSMLCLTQQLIAAEGIHEEDARKTQTEVPGYVELMFDQQYLRLVLNASGMLELPTLNCERDIEIMLTANEVYRVELDGIALQSGVSQTYRLDRLDKNRTIPILITDMRSGANTEYTLATWPSTVPMYSVVGESPYEGDYYLTLINGGQNTAMKVGTDGELKYYYHNNYGCIADFKKVKTADGVRYLMFTTIAGKYATRGVTFSGCYVVMDENYHEINRLWMKKTDHVPADNYPVEQHDCLYISDNEYYLTSYVDKNVYNIPDTIEHKKYGTLVSAAVIQGIRNGEVFFEWDSTDHPELYAYSVEYNDYTNMKTQYSADYMHVNTIALDPKDGNLIASFRNIDALIKIDVKTSDIIWILSGIGDQFGLTQEQKTSRQHYAHYTDLGSITVFDNGNANQQTRVVEYWLDEENRTLKDFKSYQIDGYFSFATGSAQRIDNEKDVFMIGWGFRDVAEKNFLYPQFSEIDFASGKTLFEFRFQDTSLSTYRCVKCP